jgi:[CysO sulfur-carrier protein]-S-L-cysteine hydrolase
VLTLTSTQRDAILATCLRALPNEGCGLLLGSEQGTVSEVVPSENVADSAKIYEIDPAVLLATFRRVDRDGVTMLGVFHSHTHSEAYPSPTDVRQAPDPSWHYVLVSLVPTPPEIRSFRVIDGLVTEESLSIDA